MVADPSPREAAALPLKPIALLILLAVDRREMHGYALRQEVLDLSEGTTDLDTGTLYRWLARLLDDGWVQRRAAAPGEDERRRNYRITPLGRRILELECARLRRLVGVSRLVRGRA